MAQELSEDEQIQRLIRKAEVARAALKHDVIALKAKWDIPKRIGASLKDHPAGWLLGSLGFGLVGSLLFRRRPAKTAEKAAKGGLFLSLLGLALTAARPLAKVWLTGQVKNYITGRPNGYLVSRLTQRRTKPQTTI